MTAYPIQRALKIALVMLLAALILQRSSLEPGDVSQRARAFTRAIEFDYATWGGEALFLKLRLLALGAADYLPPESQTRIVLDYLGLLREVAQLEGQLEFIYADPAVSDPEMASAQTRQRLADLYGQRAHLAPLAESILQNQLNVILSEAGLTLGGQAIPPVFYHVTPLPLALILSPRETIRQEASISLIPELTVADRERIEAQVDGTLGVASLVVNVGGVGMYPTMVMQTTDLNWLAEVVAHEWIHNYLTLRPLGASYLSSPELRTMNETTANLAGKELGAALIARFYPAFVPPPPAPMSELPAEAPAPPPEPPAFDFRAEMHQTRLTVDELLAAGQVAEAEAYMETRRQFFWEHGYRIRKLNQAFFAFHGAYADTPGGAASAEDPVGPAVRTLRAQSRSLAEFIHRIAWMWTFEQLEAATATP